MQIQGPLSCERSSIHILELLKKKRHIFMIIDLRDDVARHYSPNYILQQSIVTISLIQLITAELSDESSN